MCYCHPLVLFLGPEQLASAQIACVVFWALWMVGRMFITGSLLRKLPYVPTRYQQLSYRFFGLQVGLISPSLNVKKA